jgi:two-component system, LytTR family, sensor kinase
MKITNEKSRLFAIALLMSLLVNVPKILMLSSGNAARLGLIFGALDFVLPIIYGFCFAALILYTNTYSTLGFWQKMGLFAFLYVACTVVFVQTHWRLSGVNEHMGIFRLGYYFRDFILLLTAILVSNFLKMLNQKQILSLRNQHLENVKLKAELNALKQQLNPHFLFNSLNTLHSLIREDVTTSQFYLENLATVLRFSLDVQHKELIPIAEELRLLKAYNHLLSIRFGEKLKIEMPNTEGVAYGFVPPLALQLLVENAVKHNEISTKKPLLIRINVLENGQFIEVINNLTPKPVDTEGSGLGLHNLNARYQLIGNKDITIKDDNNFFTVTIPILTHDNFNHRR